MSVARTTRALVAASLAAAASLGSADAAAFCGFYVSGADAKLFNNATQVALLREGTRTVLSMQNSYQGPPSDFAMVVPVPVVLQKEQVKTLSHELFEHLDRLSAPRLVEYHELDPCRSLDGYGYDFDDDPLSAGGFGPNDATIRVRPGAVRVESRFSVGEYDVAVLSASDALSLDAWLRQNGYKIPAGAEPFLRPYVLEGMKFFVAKVDISRVKMASGSATLSPLRFHYDSESFRLPVRLGLINSSGKQDLIVHVLGRGQRYEAANYANATAPTNLRVLPAAKASFGSFYSSLFDRVIASTPGAVVTEYSWQAGNCDPCPGPALAPADIAALGADTLPAGLWKSELSQLDPSIGVESDPSWVLTRLHARYDARSLGEDLVFRAAPAIEGGRGVPGPDGALTSGAQPARENQFQGRYVMLHRFAGEVKCEAPARGQWGEGRPSSAAASPAEVAALPSGSTDPISLLDGTDGVDRSLLAGPSAPPAPARGDCAGCSVTPRRAALPALLLGASPLAGLALRRRRRRASARTA
jgi:hypothetical protein